MDNKFDKKALAVISTKNPTELLLETLANLKIYYPEFDIVIIDSDSEKKELFDKIPSDVIIEYAQNKNWETGAFKYAYTKYNNYAVYMFIQDSLIPIERIPNFSVDTFLNGTLYSFHYNAAFIEGGYLDYLYNVYKNTNLSFLNELDPNTIILGTAHTSFITNNENVNTILQLEDVYIQKGLKKCKIDSWLTERVAGILADKATNTRVDITPFFLKRSLHRDY